MHGKLFVEDCATGRSTKTPRTVTQSSKLLLKENDRHGNSIILPVGNKHSTVRHDIDAETNGPRPTRKAVIKLIELLVVIAILFSLLLPAVQQARAPEELNAGTTSSQLGWLCTTTAMCIPPSLQAISLERSTNLILPQGKPALDLPSGTTLDASNYVGIFGYGNVSMGAEKGNSVFYLNSSTRICNITDGTSNTICVGARMHKHDDVPALTTVDSKSTWYAVIPGTPRPAGMAMMVEQAPSLVLGHVGQDAMGIMAAMHQTPHQTKHIVNFSRNHTGGVHFLLCDSPVHFMSESIDYDTFRNPGKRSAESVVVGW